MTNSDFPSSAESDVAKRLVDRADSHDRMAMGSAQHLGFFSTWDAQLMRDAADTIAALKEANNTWVDLHGPAPLMSAPAQPEQVPVAYLHQARDVEAEPSLSFEPARNHHQWTSEPLYASQPSPAATVVSDTELQALRESSVQAAKTCNSYLERALKAEAKLAAHENCSAASDGVEAAAKEIGAYLALYSIDAKDVAEIRSVLARHLPTEPQGVPVTETVGIEEIIDLIRGEFPLTKDNASARRLGCAIRDRYTVVQR